MNQVKVETRGRKKKVVEVIEFDKSTIKFSRGSELRFNDNLFIPMKTGREIDVLLSTEGGLMPATNMVITGGPGSGKTTIVLDMLADFTRQGMKCLFVSGEMDEIGYYKYCKRLPKSDCVQTLFLKNYSSNIKQTIEYVFSLGFDVIAIDSIAEVLEMYKDSNKCTESAAEFWFLNLQDKTKKGELNNYYYTSFINIQQVTKAGDFVGSNRLKHMTEAMGHIERSGDGLTRSLYFSKNRDCDKDFKLYFTIYQDSVFYTYDNNQK